MVSVRRIMLLCGAAFFGLWLAALNGVGDIVLWSACAAGVLAAGIWMAARVRARRRCSAFGVELRYASMILLSRDKWANLIEILDLSVDADLRRSHAARIRGVVTGTAWADRRAVRYIPPVIGLRATPYGMAVMVAGVPGQSWDTWDRHCGHLSSALRVREVTVTEPRPGTFELQLRVRDPLGTPTVLSVVPPSRGWELPLGVDERGALIGAPCSNLSGVVLGGVPGSGKTSWLTLMMASLASRNDVQWLLIDGKQGYDLEPLARRAYRYISGEAAGDLEIVRAALQDVQALMRERLSISRDLYKHANLWSVGPSRLHPAVIVVVDECQSYLDAKSFTSKELKATAAEIDAIIRDLVKRGRSAGIMVVLSTQRPTADSIPTSTRDNCALRVCFSVRTRESATAVLGEFSADSTLSPIGAPTGVGVSCVNGLDVRFRSPLVSEDAVREHICASSHLVANPIDLFCDAIEQLIDRVEIDLTSPQKDPESSDTSRPRPVREPSEREE